MIMPGWLHAFGWTLIHVIWQAPIVAAIVWLLLRRTRSPSRRHALAMLGLVAIAGLAVVTLRVELALHEALALAAPGGASVPSLLAMVRATIDPLVPILMIAWSLGAGGFGIRLGLGAIGLVRLRRRSLALTGELEQRCRAIAERMGITRTVQLAESARIHVPMTIGALRPLILLPLGLATRIAPDQLDAALAHELAHVRRHDWLVNLVGQVIEALLFYHPCVAWLGRVARTEREHACDDRVIDAGHDRVDYAKALVELERFRGLIERDPVRRLSMAVDGSPLLDRVRRLLTTEVPDAMTTMINTTTTTATNPTRHLRSGFAPWLLALGLGSAGVVVACSTSHDETELREGLLGPDDRGEAELDVAWLPDDIQALAPELEQAARRHGVDPALLAIVVLVESGGDPAARSPSGARGLMQLMPKTAAVIADERGLGDHDEAQLDDPSYNLDFGAYFLARQLDRFGSVELAAAAYNGGEQAVERWLAGEAQLSDETAHYKTLVDELWQERHAARSATLDAARAR
jgi:beta-lactamase regulating signal transducer with metallopeptidase domain